MSRWKTQDLLDHPNFGKLVLKNENNREASAPVLERSPGLGALGKGKVKKGNSRRFLVVVTSFRRRLLDEDNLCEKFHVDCCRYAGCLPSDAPGEAKITTAQQKVKDREDERTEIEITELREQ